LAAGGLVKTHAFVRAERSPEAKRKKKRRDRHKDEGHAQLNVVTVAYETSRATLCAVAEALKNGDRQDAVAAIASDDPWLQRVVLATKFGSGIASKTGETIGRSELSEADSQTLRSAIDIVIDHTDVRDLIPSFADHLGRLEIVRRNSPF
jgi:hypothetical protein